MSSIVQMRQPLLILAALVGPLCLGQAQQFVLDTVSDQDNLYPSGRTVTSTADGGTILHLLTDHGNVQWKIDQSGDPVWCKQYGISSQRRARMPDGGVVFCEVTGYTSDGDTSRIRLQVVRTDAEGEVVWCKLITIYDPYVTLFNNGWLYITTNEEGDCLITMSETAGSVYQWFYCLDTEGGLLWSKNFLFNLNADHVQHISSDGQSGWFFGSYEWGASNFRMGHLNSFGELAWYNSYVIPMPQEFWLGDICSSEFQAIAVGGYEAVFNEDYRWFVMRLTLNGTLDWFRVSSTAESGLAQCIATSAGELLVANGLEGYADHLTRLSGTGEVISSLRPDTVTVAGIRYTCWFGEWDLINPTLTMGTYLLAQPDSLELPSYQPAVLRLPIAQLSACGTQANELSSMLLPNSTVQQQDQPYSEVVVPITVTDTVCSVTSFTPISVSDYCYYFTGIQPVVQPASLGRVVATLLAPGDPIHALAPASHCGITVHDAHGSVLHRGLVAPNGTELIPTSAWASGLYFVRFQPEDGGKPNVVKVMIE